MKCTCSKIIRGFKEDEVLGKHFVEDTVFKSLGFGQMMESHACVFLVYGWAGVGVSREWAQEDAYMM